MTGYKKIGLPPGSLVYSGPEIKEQAKITLIEYNEHELIEKQFSDIDTCFTFTRPDMVKWINIDGVHDASLIEKLGKLFNIHNLTLEDILNSDQRAKFEDYDDYVLCVMKMINFNGEVTSEQLSIILLNDMVISFQEYDKGDAFDLIRNRIRNSKGKIRKSGADYLAYCLLDAVVDCYFSVLEKIGDEIETVEEVIAENPDKETMTRLYYLKREMIFLRKAIWPIREMIGNMERSDNKLIKPSTDVYLRDVYDHAIRVIDTVETYRDLLSGMMDIYMSSVSNKMNEVMKVLTIITTLFVPVTFIAGVYGMNFKFMPELESPYGYALTWLVMLGIMASLLVYFKRKKWL